MRMRGSRRAYRLSRVHYLYGAGRHYSRYSRSDIDVVVVGAGVAGVSASISAAEKGASVILLDASHGGGATALSGGVVYAGGGTDQQKAAGYGDDTPENMFRYLQEETHDAVDADTLWDFCQGSVARLKWMERHGARFQGSLCPYKTSYPTDEHYLYFSGNEKSHPYNKVAKPAPRGHRMASPGFSGAALWAALFQSALSLGVEFVPTSRVSRILLDEQRAAAGVEFRSLDPSTKAFRHHKWLTALAKRFALLLPGLAARIQDRADSLWQREGCSHRLQARSVILAAGGFAFNPSMREKHIPEYAKVAPLGTRGDDGSGIQLGISAGGSVGKMNNMSAWRFLYPPVALLEGVVVSQNGRRFVPEDLYGATLSDRMIRENGSKGFLVLDSTQWAKAKQQLFQQTQLPLLFQRLHWLAWDFEKAPSLELLAAKSNIALNALQHTVNAYNEAIEKGEKDPMNKEAEYCTPIVRPPFYCLDISARLSGIQAVSGLTLGGLRVAGETGLVLREDGTSIQGLYAAGRNAVGICSNGYVSGLSIADGVFSGRRAGEHAAVTSQSM